MWCAQQLRAMWRPWIPLTSTAAVSPPRHHPAHQTAPHAERRRRLLEQHDAWHGRARDAAPLGPLHAPLSPPPGVIPRRGPIRLARASFVPPLLAAAAAARTVTRAFRRLRSCTWPLKMHASTSASSQHSVQGWSFSGTIPGEATGLFSLLMCLA